MLDIVSTKVEVETCTDDAATAVLLNGDVDFKTVRVLSPEGATELSEGEIAVEVELELGEVETIGPPSDEAAVVLEEVVVLCLLEGLDVRLDASDVEDREVPWLDAFDNGALVDAAEVAVLTTEDGELGCPKEVVNSPDEGVDDVVDCRDELIVEVEVTELGSGEVVELLRPERLVVDDIADS